jgi:hypothetical protein
MVRLTRIYYRTTAIGEGEMVFMRKDGRVRVRNYKRPGVYTVRHNCVRDGTYTVRVLRRLIQAGAPIYVLPVLDGWAAYNLENRKDIGRLWAEAPR